MRKIIFASVIIGFFICWYLALIFFNIPQYLLPAPNSIIHAFVSNPEILFKNFLTTFAEALLGFVIANVLSVIIALVVSLYRQSEHYVLPIAIALKTIPVVAIAPLLILWLGSNMAPKVATAALICFFPALVNILGGIKSISEDYIELFKVYSASKTDTVRYLFLPYSLPFIFSSLKISSSLAVVGALVGEFLGSNHGLGFLILTNYYSLNTPIVFASIILSSGLGVILYYLINYIETKTLTWKY